MSINREMNLLLTGTSKSILSVFDVRQPQKSIEVRTDSSFSNLAIFLDFNAMLRHLDREESVVAMYVVCCLMRSEQIV